MSNLIEKTIKRRRKSRFDFEVFFGELLEYRNEHGNLLVPQKYANIKTKYALGQSVSCVRSGNIRLDQEQKLRLNKIGFVWNAKKKFDFETALAELQKYKKLHGNLLVPQQYTSSDTNYLTGRVVSRMRSGDIKLDETQKARLNEIGFVWDADVRFEFEKFMNRLLIYKQEYGDTLVPYHYIEEETQYPLGRNVADIRSGHIHLNQEQKLILNNIGFVWYALVRFDFERFFAELLDYKQEYGNLLVPQKYINGKTQYPLGQAVSNVRAEDISLTQEQKLRLNNIDFIWNARIGYTLISKFEFDVFYQELLKYKQEYNNLFIPFGYDLYKSNLGRYVRFIRTKRIALSTEQKAKLEKIGFLFDTHNVLYNNIISSKTNIVVLLQQMANGDMIARQIVIERFMPFVKNRVCHYKYLQKKIDVESVVFEAFYYSLDLYDVFAGKTFTHYLKRTIRNFVSNEIKKRSNLISVETLIYSQKNEDLTLLSTLKAKETERPDNATISKLFLEDLKEVAKTVLTKSEYKVLMLFCGVNKLDKSLTVEEIASYYHTDTTKVENALNRAKIKLKNKLNEEEWNI